MKNFSQVNHMNENISSGIVSNVANFSADLKHRAFKAYVRSSETLAPTQPSQSLSGLEMFDGLPYVVLRNCDGILAVYRVRMKNGRPGLNRLEEWPEGLDK